MGASDGSVLLFPFWQEFDLFDEGPSPHDSTKATYGFDSCVLWSCSSDKCMQVTIDPGHTENIKQAGAKKCHEVIFALLMRFFSVWPIRLGPFIRTYTRL